MYNHHMNGVDRADQLRSYYTTQTKHNKTWKALWHFLLDTTTTNAYKLAYDRLEILAMPAEQRRRFITHKGCHNRYDMHSNLLYIVG